MRKRFVTITAAAVFAAATTSFAAPVSLQDYEAPGNLDEPFNVYPHYSGSTQGIFTDPVSTVTHVLDDGAGGTAQSAEFMLQDNPAAGSTAGNWNWQVRLLPNTGAAVSATNPAFATDGYVGFYLKVDPSYTADVQVAPVLEVATGDATVGTLQTVIKDGGWHLYQWNMDDPAAFDTAWKDVYDLGSTLGDTDLEATNSFDSIALVSSGGGDLTFRLDEIQYDNAGPIGPIPEPASLGLLSIAGLAMTRRRR